MRYRCAYDENDCRFQSEDDMEIARHVRDTGHGRCVIDGASLTRYERQTCTEDLGRVRANLRDIADLYALLPATLGHIGSNAPRRDATRHGDGSERLPGGDALVMLAGGSEGARWAWPNPERYPTVNDNGPHDPPAVLFELGNWIDDWAEARHEPPTSTVDAKRTVTGAVRWLALDRCAWAASWHKPEAFVGFADDMARIRAALVRATGTSTAPETREARCINLDCKGCDTVKLERGYGDDGRADYWSCPICRRQYGQHGYHLALAATLARRGVSA